MENRNTKVEGTGSSQHSNNAVLGEVPKITGDIHISYTVYCPQCGKHYDDYYDKEWFDNTMGSDFPVDDGYNQQFNAKCDGCGQEFIVDGFVH